MEITEKDGMYCAKRRYPNGYSLTYGDDRLSTMLDAIKDAYEEHTETH